MKKKEKKCTFCEIRKKMKPNVKESYSREGSIDSYLKEISFAKNKPFKISFNEEFSVSFKNNSLNEQKSKKMKPEEKNKNKDKKGFIPFKSGNSNQKHKKPK
jgi:hypothetical protein